MNLAFDDHWVHLDADIVNAHVLAQLDLAGFSVYLQRCEVGAVGI